ncbi:MAG TPA: fimbria/pilus periplasmic chaperone [Rhizomicrobium sp.]|jgi:fimbrial chaperone protein|nr:fimbria/pilus periplasmic chaperone [Rhizomicrobium sp.]
MRFHFSATLWMVAAVLQTCATAAGGATLEIAPTTIALQDKDKAGVLYVNNYGNAAVTVQVEPFDWQQADGTDRLSPSQDLMVSPPITAIPPQGRQTIRLLVTPGDSHAERSFRLIVSELPDPNRLASRTVQVLTRFSIPVFVDGPADAMPNFIWQATVDHGEMHLTLRNEGAHHAKLQDLKIVTPANDAIAVANGGLNYILPGAIRSWKAACAQCAPGEAIHVSATDGISGTKLDQPLVLER